MAQESLLPFEDEKEEKLVLYKGERKKRKKNVEVEKGKWLGVILNEDSEFDTYWKGQITKAHKMLGALNSIVNSQ